MLPRKHTIDGAQLGNMWNVNIVELAYLIMKLNISVLSPSQVPSVKFFFNPKEYRIDTVTLLNIIQSYPFDLYRMQFWEPEIEKLSSKATAFRYSKIKGSGKTRRGLYRLGKSPEPSNTENALKDVVEIHEDKIKNNSNVFSLVGKVWFVKFNQKEWGLYPDHKKYKYIAHLLNLAANDGAEDNQEVSISNLNLNLCVDPKDLHTEKNNYSEDGLGELDSTEQLSQEEIQIIKENLKNLLNRIELAKDYDDEALIDHAKEEFFSYVKILKQQGVVPLIKDDGDKIFLKCQTRLDKGNEKIRQLVKNNIRNAIRDFNDRMPGLREHLEHFCKTRLTETIYHPIPPASWFVSF